MARCGRFRVWRDDQRYGAHYLSCNLGRYHSNLFKTVDRLPSSVVLDDDDTRGDDVEAHASQSRGYQPLSSDLVSIAASPPSKL